MYPRYGPKDGDTVVQVWGKNFLDLGEDFRCNFGTASTKAYFINENYIWCRAARSDVTSRPMPFSVSMNRQQNSVEKFEYWYYNEPQITTISPDYGPLSGGTKVLVKGSPFLPFDWKLDINNQNDTFCNWGPLGKTHAQVLSTTEAECVSPVNNQHYDWVPVNLTLNNQNYTDENIKFYYYNPPKIVDVQPLRGPVKGGTEINLWGVKYERNRNVTCIIGNKTTQARYITKSHLICPAPTQLEPGDYQLTVKYSNDRFESDTFNFYYYADPELSSVGPACGPVEGFTQINVRGKNFHESGFGKAKCIFNATIYMNATVLDASTIVCDSPPLESINGDMWYNVSITLDGDFKTKATGKFFYYTNPTMRSIFPVRGPVEGGTVSIINGAGFT